MRLPRWLKTAIVVVVLVVAFVVTALVAVVAAVNLSVSVQNSNRKLERWISQLGNKSYRVYYRSFNPTSSTVKAGDLSDFEKMLKDHEVTEAFWEWTKMELPLTIVYGKIWFIDGEVTYYIETTW